MSENIIARTPEPPYYAVIFTSIRTPGDEGYGEMSERMLELASAQDGFIGAESLRAADGFGITICYWKTLEGIKRWKQETEHRLAQQLGRERWYQQYRTRICKVEQDYGFERNAERRTMSEE